MTVEGRGPADLVLVGGKVTTGTGAEHEAIAVRGDRVHAVGTNAEISALADDATVHIDLAGSRAIPGLIDSHIHMLRGGLTWNTEVRWAGLPNLAAGLDLIGERAAEWEAGTWITVVGGWHPGQFKEGVGPTAQDLNEVAPNHPVYVQRNFEEAILNDAALDASGIGGMAEDPPMGTIERDGSGKPTGMIRGPGAFRIAMMAAGMPDFETQVTNTRAMLRDFNRFGLTGAIDPGGFGVVPEMYRPLMELWRRGERGFRSRLLVVPSQPGSENEDINSWIKFAHPGFGDSYVRYLGFGEIVLFGAHDMEGTRSHEINEGVADNFRVVSQQLADAGWPMHMHAILDSSVDMVLDAWEAVNETKSVADLRFSLVHADQISERNLQRVSDLGIGITVQHRLVFRAADSLALWGEESFATAPPLRRMLDLGIPIGGGSDGAVVSSYNPWRSIWWLVTGQSQDGAPPRDESQRLTREEALSAYTAGSAWFSFEEEERGKLTPGALADLAVLSSDFFEVAEDSIPSLKSVLTMVGGEIVHVAGRYTDLYED